jgi:hypothetical protein
MIIMKKFLLWLPVVWLIFGAAVYSTTKGNTATEKTTNANISFAVYKSDNYSSDVYNTTSATVHITITKVSGNNRTVVWDKTFDAKLLKQYPSLEHAITQQVTIPNVLDQKEHLEVTYTLTYNSNGSELQMQNGTEVYGSSDKLNISI